jgi:hypothetical protein
MDRQVPQEQVHQTVEGLPEREVLVVILEELVQAVEVVDGMAMEAATVVLAAKNNR